LEAPGNVTSPDSDSAVTQKKCLWQQKRPPKGPTGDGGVNDGTLSLLLVGAGVLLRDVHIEVLSLALTLQECLVVIRSDSMMHIRLAALVSDVHGVAVVHYMAHHGTIYRNKLRH
jgi:hypothetical protein